MGGQYLHRVGLVGFGIHVGNSDIQKTICARGDQRLDIRRSPQSSQGEYLVLWWGRGRKSRRCRGYHWQLGQDEEGVHHGSSFS